MLAQHGDEMDRKGAPPALGCPSCPAPPFWLLPLLAPPPVLFQHVPPGPCWGLAILRALPPTPTRGDGRAEGNTFLIVSLPFMGCQGAEAAAPRPFPLRSLFILISSPAPLANPHPACPTDALQMGARRPLRPQPLPALDFLQPRTTQGPPERGASPLPHTHRVPLRGDQGSLSSAQEGQF